ncbi:MAG: T9SS type A sorting domain-containing protein, partial [Bacteroidia bacterium]
FLCAFGFQLQAQKSVDYTVQAWVTVNKTTPSITINWQKVAGATKYNIYRKAKEDASWGTVEKGSVNGTDTTWTDKDVKVGIVYEYNIIKVVGTQNSAITYILSGIEVPAVHSRGNCLVLVEKELAISLSGDLDAYYRDIAADGWKVYGLQVSKTDSIQKVRREIKKIDAQSGGLKTLVILGHVPVPYAGNFGQGNYGSAPDGHVPDHNGAWPTDSYYAIDYNDWTDFETNTSGITRAENKNLPGDSKWDDTEFPGLIKYYTGRIDLSNMPKFTKTEAELTKQYIKKAHDFRYKITKTVDKGVIDENFAASYGAFASTGWRNFSVMFGPKNITEADYFTTCQSENLLFAYGTGAGSYTACNGIGTTDDFVTKKGAIFNMLFGSYFGDWDNVNNILRAPLASAENGLTNAWSGRPYWQNHPMALGEPIGYCAMITQNNRGLYTYNVFANTVPIGLMGDPTLRLNMIAPPTSVVATPQSNNTKVSLSWTASTEAGVIGYYIYRSSTPLSINVPVNSVPVTGTSFVDNTPFQGTNYYLVKAVKLTTTASGSYYNLSHGNDAFVTGMTGGPVDVKNSAKQTVSVYPNPTKDIIQLQFTYYTHSNLIEILNAQGQLVKTMELELNSDLVSKPVSITDLAAGLYFIKAGNVTARFIKE